MGTPFIATLSDAIYQENRPWPVDGTLRKKFFNMLRTRLNEDGLLYISAPFSRYIEGDTISYSNHLLFEDKIFPFGFKHLEMRKLKLDGEYYKFEYITFDVLEMINKPDHNDMYDFLLDTIDIRSDLQDDDSNVHYVLLTIPREDFGTITRKIFIKPGSTKHSLLPKRNNGENKDILGIEYIMMDTTRVKLF